MTVARDAIAAWFADYFYNVDPGGRAVEDAEAFLAFIEAAPKPMRLDLASRLGFRPSIYDRPRLLD